MQLKNAPSKDAGTSDVRYEEALMKLKQTRDVTDD